VIKRVVLRRKRKLTWPVSIAPWLFGWSPRSTVLPRLARATSDICAAFTRPSSVFVSAIGASEAYYVTQKRLDYGCPSQLRLVRPAYSEASPVPAIAESGCSS
jgi:hypothetical protein